MKENKKYIWVDSVENFQKAKEILDSLPDQIEPIKIELTNEEYCRKCEEPFQHYLHRRGCDPFND